MIVGGLEEIRVDEPANEIYVLDYYLNGRVLVFSLDTFQFKRGWGAQPVARTAAIYRRPWYDRVRTLIRHDR